ncbi:MAG: glycine oxidase ThiO [Methylococcales bacterium]
MSRVSDILVIGGGIAGLLTAREFILAGYATTLIEKQKVGREASWAGGGILSPIYPWRQAESIMLLCKESNAIYPRLASDLKESTGIDPEWTSCGMVVLEEPEQGVLAWCEKNAVPACRIDPIDVDNLIPRAEVIESPVLWLPEVAQIRNPRLLTALQIDLKNKGVTLFEDTEVTGFSVQNGRIRGVRTNQQTFSAAEIVIAAGAWSNTFSEPFPPQPEIFPVKGQMLLYKAKPSLLKPIVLSNDQYLIPRLDGHILVGSTVEFSGFDKTTTLEARRQLDSFARRILPSLPRDSLIDQWAGLRPGSPSGIPTIGRHPVISNLSFNCGHFRNGIAMGPAAARLLADLLTEREPRIPPEPYAVARKR